MNIFLCIVCYPVTLKLLLFPVIIKIQFEPLSCLILRHNDLKISWHFLLEPAVLSCIRYFLHNSVVVLLYFNIGSMLTLNNISWASNGIAFTPEELNIPWHNTYSVSYVSPMKWGDILFLAPLSVCPSVRPSVRSPSVRPSVTLSCPLYILWTPGGIFK